MVLKLPGTPTTPGFFISIMRYIDNFKFFSPFTKDRASKVIDQWTTEMNEFALKTSSENPVITIVEARMMWIMYKMAELETTFGNHIANS